MNFMKEIKISPVYWCGGDCINNCAICPYCKSIDKENGVWKVTCELEDDED